MLVATIPIILMIIQSVHCSRWGMRLDAGFQTSSLEMLQWKIKKEKSKKRKLFNSLNIPIILNKSTCTYSPPGVAITFHLQCKDKEIMNDHATLL